MKLIRVVRVLEYTYADADVMAQDMKRWGVQGVRVCNGYTIRAATLPTVELVEAPETDGRLAAVADALTDCGYTDKEARVAAIAVLEGKS